MHANALWRLRPYLRPHYRRIFFMVVAAGSGLGAATLVPLVIKAVIDGPVSAGRREGIPLLALAALALGLFETLAAFTRRFIAGNLAIELETSLRSDLYAHLQRLPVAFHDKWQSGQLLSRAMTDVRVIRRFFGFGLVFFVVNSSTFLIVMVLMVGLEPVLAGITALSAVPLVVLSRRFEREYLAVSRQVQDHEGDLATLVEESATGIRAVKAFGRRRLLGARFGSQASMLHRSSMDQVRLRARFWSLIDMIPNLTLAAVLLFGALAVGRGDLSLGGLVAFVSLLILLVWPIESLGEILAMAEEATSAANRIFEVFDTKPAIADRPGAVVLAHVRGAIRFDGVGFSYEDGRPVLRHVDLEVAPGETLAVVGMTGSGKTTLVSLLPRLHDVSEGRVSIDGDDVRDLKLSSLRSHIAVAFEDPVLFSASVRENLLLGAPNATNDEVEQALDITQCGFVYDLPWGLETRIGEQGLSLSGGQRQRLALARAVIARPRVLVLDDPLSALDVHTEARVHAAMHGVLADVTTLVVVHRPSTVAVADRVAFLHDGRIAASGSHSQLLQRIPAYRDVLSREVEEMAG